MHNLTVRVFEELEITSPLDMDQRVAYMQRIFKGAALKNNREVLVGYRKLAKNSREMSGTLKN